MSRQLVDKLARSANLELFEWVSPNKAHCRCPFCGDSKKDKNKRRGGFIVERNETFYNCFNCGKAGPLWLIIKELDENLYKSLRFENLKDTCNLNSSKPLDTSVNINKFKNHKVETESVIDITDVFMSNTICVSDLGENHDVVKYLKSRRLPTRFKNRLYYTHDFNDLIKSLDPNRDVSKHVKEAVVFPWLWSDGSLFGMQARYLEGDFRYKSVLFDKTYPKCFGWDTINVDKTINVFEGAFDTAFVNNSIAVLDGALHNRCEQLQVDKSKFLLWFDNECRTNEHTAKHKAKALDIGYRVVFYPPDFKWKDLNDARLDLSNVEFRKMLQSCKFESGLKAKMLHYADKTGTQLQY